MGVDGRRTVVHNYDGDGSRGGDCDDEGNDGVDDDRVDNDGEDGAGDDSHWGREYSILFPGTYHGYHIMLRFDVQV